MRILYNILAYIISFFLPVVSIFSKKIRKMISGQKLVWKYLDRDIDKSSKYIWVHVASLGEYEQSVPLLKKLKEEFSDYKIILTFFSPSGFEVKKDTSEAHFVYYLPLDTPKNAKRFIQKTHPAFAFFVKYEFWPNYLKALENKNIPTFLISGIFRENQIFFKPYGEFLRKSLHAFSYFFVQNQESKKLLQQIGFSNVDIAGDTRFERVMELANNQEVVKELQCFSKEKDTDIIVVGSAWKEDMEILFPLINDMPKLRWIIAPHEINETFINYLKQKIHQPLVCFSEKQTEQEVEQAHVFILDTIGLLSKAYIYGKIAFVGGAFRTGLHNVLEPAAYGLPVIIGTEYQKFDEAKKMVALGTCFSVNTTQEVQKIITELLDCKEKYQEVKQKNQQFIQENSNSTAKIISKIHQIINKK